MPVRLVRRLFSFIGTASYGLVETSTTPLFLERERIIRELFNCLRDSRPKSKGVFRSPVSKNTVPDDRVMLKNVSCQFLQPREIHFVYIYMIGTST